DTDKTFDIDAVAKVAVIMHGASGKLTGGVRLLETHKKDGRSLARTADAKNFEKILPTTLRCHMGLRRYVESDAFGTATGAIVNEKGHGRREPTIRQSISIAIGDVATN